MRPLPPAALTAVSTGSGKVTLYWSGVANATGYNIYRGTAAGGEDYAHPINGATPVTTKDTGPGVTNKFMYSDINGLTNGTEYFYTVKAANGTAQSGPSNEDSDAPDPTAIPWDTGSTSVITSMIRQNESDQTGLNYSPSYCSLRVMGPDGVIYQEGTSSMLPPDGNIDPVQGTMMLGNVLSPAGHFVQEATSSTLTASSTSPLIASNPPASVVYGGGIRRVTSTLTGPDGNVFTGTSGTVYLPSTADTSYMSVAPSSSLGNREGPNAYIGMSSDGVEADAGIMFVPANFPVGSGLPNRWDAFLRVYDGPKNKDYQPVAGVNPFRVMGDQYSYIYADSQIGNDADLKFTINRHDKTCGLFVFGYDYAGFYYARWYVAASTNIKPFTHSLQHLQMKREISLDQTINPGVRYTPFSNAITQTITNKDGTHEKKTTFGYVSTGSYMEGIGWQYGSLYQGSTMLDWTSSLMSESYYSQLPYANQVVYLSPPGGNPQNETVDIEHF